MSSMISLKVKHADSTRKVFLPPSPPPVWPRLASALRDRFHVPPNQMIGLRYLDPESDLITVSSQGELDDLWDEIRAGAKLKEKDGVFRKVVRLDLVIINSFPGTALEIASSSTRLLPASDVILQDKESISKFSGTTFGPDFLVSFEITFAASQSIFPFDVPYSMLSSLELQSVLAMGRNVFDLPISVHLSLHIESGGKLEEIASQQALQTVLSSVGRPIPAEKSGEGAGQAIRLIIVELSPTPTYPLRDVEDADGFVNVSSPSTITYDDDSNVPQTAVKTPHATNHDFPIEVCGSLNVGPSTRASPCHASIPPVHPNGHGPLDAGFQHCHSSDSGQARPPLQYESAPDPPEEVAEDPSDPDIEPLPAANTVMHDISAPLSQLVNMAFNQPIGFDLARTLGNYANLIADATGQLSHVCRTLAQHVNSSQPPGTPFMSSLPTAPKSSAPAAPYHLADGIFTAKCNPQAHCAGRASSETVANQAQPVANERNPDSEAFLSSPKIPHPEAEKSQSGDVPVPSPFNVIEGAEPHVSGLFMNSASAAAPNQGRIHPPDVTQRLPASMLRQTAPLRNLAPTPHQMDSTPPVNISPSADAAPQQAFPRPSFAHECGHPSSHDATFTGPSNLPSLPWYPYLGFEGRAPTPFHVGHLPHNNHYIARPPMIPPPYNWASNSDCANRSFPGTPFWHQHQALKAGHDPCVDISKPSEPFHEFTDPDFPEKRQASGGRFDFSNCPTTRQHFSLENMFGDFHFEPPTGSYKTPTHTPPGDSCMHTTTNRVRRGVSGRATSSQNADPKVIPESPDLSSTFTKNYLFNNPTEIPHPTAKNEPVYKTKYADVLQLSKKSWRERDSPRVSKLNVKPDSPDAQDSYIVPAEASLASFVDRSVINNCETGETGETSSKYSERKADLMKNSHLVAPNQGELWDSDEPPSVDEVGKRAPPYNGSRPSNSTSAIEIQLARIKKTVADYNDEFALKPKKMPNGWSCDEPSFIKAKVDRGWVPYDESSFQVAQDRRDVVEVASVSQTPIFLGESLKLSEAEDTTVRPWGHLDRDARGRDGWPINDDSGRDLFEPTGGKKKKRNKKKNDRGSLLD